MKLDRHTAIEFSPPLLAPGHEINLALAGTLTLGTSAYLEIALLRAAAALIGSILLSVAGSDII